MIARWTCDEEARGLLPGHDPKTLFIVLFLSPGPQAQRLVERFRQLAFPRGARAAVLDVSCARESAEWFGITRTPAIAAIADGSLLAIDYDCDQQRCEEVAALALQQLQRLAAVDQTRWG